MNIGILGGGQLARMLALAAIPLGHRTVCLDPTPNPSAAVASEIITAEFTDQTALKQLIAQTDVITIETENIPLTALQFVMQHTSVYPSLLALQTCQDRLLEKQFCHSMGIPTANFWEINCLNELHAACKQCGFPAILKTRRMGYDGKGQHIIQSSADINIIWQQSQQRDLILEQWVNFDRELSCFGVRNLNGDFIAYPITENRHIDGILHTSTAPAAELESIQPIAHHYLQTMANAFEYVGVLAIELFQVGNELLINEMAPRVHNSGHWTIQGAACSQFENHIRAITAMPLGKSDAIGISAMINAISEMPDCQELLAIPFTHWHDYDKTPRDKRKLGHAVLHCQDQASLQVSLTSLLTIKPFNREGGSHD